MKIFRIFLYFVYLVSLTTNTCAQSDTARLYQTYNLFSNPGKAEWTAFQNNWNYFDYSLLKQKYKVKELSCNSCESFYADVYIEIDETGNISFAKCILVKLCGIQSVDKLLKIDFESSVKKQHFKSIAGKKFIVRLGHLLKC